MIRHGTTGIELLGAGNEFSNGGDDFRWMDVWRIARPPKTPNVFKDSLPRFAGEVLYLEKSESASGYVGWIGKRFVWYQVGD